MISLPPRWDAASPYSLAMTAVRSTQRWLREHPTGADALLALLALVMAALPYFDELRNELDGQRPGLVFVLLVAACLLLVLRRRRPWSVLLATTALGLVATALSESPNPVYVPAVIALYTVSAREISWRLVGAVAVSIVLPTVLIVGLGPSTYDDERAHEITWWVLVAAVSGFAVRSHRALVEEANERARQAEATREESAARAVTEERLRIARELHDVVAHHVAVINVQAGVARQLLRDDPDRASEALGHVRESSQTVLSEVPGMLGLLRRADDPGDQRLPTAPAPRLADAEALVEQARRSGLQVVWSSTGQPTPLSPGTDLTAYRVLQEALTNASRHGSGEVRIQLTHEPDGLTIEVRNPRAGDSPAATDRHGLVGMRERVTAAGGTFTAGPEAPGTWAVRARLPLAAQALDEPVRSR